MAISPRWKVYDSEGKYQASCKDLVAAAALVSLYSTGATIKDSVLGGTVWREGKEVILAGESYDRVSLIIQARVEAKYQKKTAERKARMDKWTVTRSAQELKWVKCIGEAHQPGNMSDHCGVCMPYWGDYPTCPDCGKRVRMNEKTYDCIGCGTKFQK